MKITKTHVVIGAVIMVVGMSSAVAAIVLPDDDTDTPKQSVAIQAPDSSDEVVVTSVAPQEQEAVATPVQARQSVVSEDVTEQPSVSVAEQNKSVLKALVDAQASNLGLSGNLHSVQWACIDRYISGGIGYENYDALVADTSPAYIFLNQPNGRMYFDAMGSCRVLNR